MGRSGDVTIETLQGARGRGALVRPLQVALVLALLTSLVVTPAEATSSTSSTFEDVPGGHVFETEIRWLAASGITQGRGDGTFGVNDPVTRGAMAAFLYRFSGEGPVFTVSETAVADLPFGTPADDVLASVSSEVGPPSRDTGWTEFFEPEFDGPGDLDVYYEDPTDSFTAFWPWPWYREVCWEVFCVNLGGDGPSGASVRGWTLNALGPDWATPEPIDFPPTPWIAIEDTGITAGSTWAAVQRAYPQASLAGGEGATVHVNDVWDDWVWILQWEGELSDPLKAPPDARLVLLAAGADLGYLCC